MEKIKIKFANLLITSNNSDGDSKNKLRLFKLISFLMFIKYVILNNLGDWNDMEDKR